MFHPALHSVLGYTRQRHEAFRTAKAGKSGSHCWSWDIVEGLLEISEDEHQYFLLLTTLILELSHSEDQYLSKAGKHIGIPAGSLLPRRGVDSVNLASDA